jgi:hypothetical protein
VGPRAGLDTEDRGKILCPRRGSNPDRPVVQPVVRHYTAWANPAPKWPNKRTKFIDFSCSLKIPKSVYLLKRGSSNVLAPNTYFNSPEKTHLLCYKYINYMEATTANSHLSFVCKRMSQPFVMWPDFSLTRGIKRLTAWSVQTSRFLSPHLSFCGKIN